MQIEIKLTILVVDDSMTSRLMLIEQIPETIKKKAEIVQASCGKEGLEKFIELNPDIMFLDLTMPEMSGQEVLKEIRTINPTAQVVIVTADRQKSTKKEVMALGANEILNKPVDPDEIRQIFYSLAFGRVEEGDE